MITAINIVSAIRGVYLLIDFVNHDYGTGWDENLVKLHLRARFTKARAWHNQSKYISVHRLQEYPETERESLRSFRKGAIISTYIGVRDETISSNPPRWSAFRFVGVGCAKP